MNAEILKFCCRKMAPKFRERADHLASVIYLYGITNPAEMIGQVMHETGRLKTLEESLNYSVDALLSMFGRHRISEADARRYGRAPGRPANQEAIGNALYGGEWGKKNLGNTQPGDGYKFRGRGLIQLTGRDAYEQFFAFMQHPQQISDPDIVARDDWWGAHAAGFFWTAYKKIDGITDVRRVTKLVTGSENHFLAEREALTVEARTLLQSAKF